MIFGFIIWMIIIMIVVWVRFLESISYDFPPYSSSSYD